MSDPQFAELRGVNAKAVADRAALVNDRQMRDLLWYLQGKSLEEGGLRKLADDLVAMFPERCCTGKVQTSRWDMRDPQVQKLDEFLLDLCINPRLVMSAEHSGSLQFRVGAVAARDEFPELAESDFRPATTPLFKNIIPALMEYKRRDESAIRERFVLTENCQPVWQALDFAARTKSIALVNGAEGRGKTEAAKAWCASHLAEARFVSLKAVANKTTAFREVARAIGIGSGLSWGATDTQARIEHVLARSRLLLCVDEAHWLFNQAVRQYSRPELVDWIGTLSNDGIPICLVTTPQFLLCMKRAADQVGWNYLQFRRRVKRYYEMKDTSPADLERVARALVPGAKAATVKLMLGYAQLSGRDLSGLGDVAREAKELALGSGRLDVSFEDVDRAIKEILLPSDANFARALQASGRVRRNAPVMPKAADSRDVMGRCMSPATIPQRAEGAVELKDSRLQFADV